MEPRRASSRRTTCTNVSASTVETSWGPPNHSTVLPRRSISVDTGSVVQTLAVRTIMASFPSSNHSATCVCTLLVLLLLKNVIRMPFFPHSRYCTTKNYFLNTAWLLIVYALASRGSGIKLDRNTISFMIRSEQIAEQIIVALFPEKLTTELYSCYYHKDFHQYFY